MTNLILDVFGLFVLIVGVVAAAYFWFTAASIAETSRPCMKEVIARRGDKITGNIHSLIVNLFAVCLFLMAKIQWVYLRLDTAPTVIDVQILVVEMTVAFALCRASYCSKKTISSLCKPRVNEKIGCDCKKCLFEGKNEAQKIQNIKP